MNTKRFFRCANCGGTDFEITKIGDILATEGAIWVHSYVCTKCGHIELFDPDFDAFADYLNELAEQERQAKIAERQKKEEERKQEMKRLEAIINDENSTVKQVREAQEKLNKLRQMGTPPIF